MTVSTFAKTIATAVLVIATSFIFFGAVFLPRALAATDNIQVGIEVNGTSSTTTPPTPGGGGGGGGGDTLESPPEIISVDVIAGVESITVIFKTDQKTIGTLKYGTDQTYAGGTLSEVDGSSTHKLTLINLEPDTRYYLRFHAENENGDTDTVTRVVTTLKVPTPDVPMNVGDFKASARSGESSVYLSWEYPEELLASGDFDYVRVTRLGERFPTDPLMGYVVYEGTADATVDRQTKYSEDYYYAIFVHTDDGKWSSGVLDFAWVPPLNEPQAPPEKNEPGQDTGDSGEGDDVPGSGIDMGEDDSTDGQEQGGGVELGQVSLSFFQDGKPITRDEAGKRVLKEDAPTTVILPRALVPEKTEVAIVTFDEHEDESSTDLKLLLSLSADGEKFVGVVPGPWGGGSRLTEFAVGTVLLDSFGRKIGTFQGTIFTRGVATGLEKEASENTGVFWWLHIWWLTWLLIILLLLFLLLFLFLLWKRRKDDEEEEEILEEADEREEKNL